MPSLSPSQIGGYWKAADPSSSENLTEVMTAISLAESSGNPSSIQSGQPYATTGWGLWQITPGNSEPSVGTDHDLLDPRKNAEAAYLKYKTPGPNGGLAQWTTYTGGAYKKYLRSVKDVQGQWSIEGAIDNLGNSTVDAVEGIPGAVDHDLGDIGGAVDHDLGDIGGAVDHGLEVTSFLGDIGSLFFTEKGWMRLLKLAAGVIIGIIAIKALFQDTFIGDAATGATSKGQGILHDLIEDAPVAAA
jgi:hypothetical protein